MQHLENLTGYDEALFERRVQDPLSDSAEVLCQHQGSTQDGDQQQRQHQQHHQTFTQKDKVGKNGTYKTRVPTAQFIVQHFENFTGYDEALFEQRVQDPLTDSDEDLCQDQSSTQDGVRANFMWEQISNRPTATCIELFEVFMDEFCLQEEQCYEVSSWGTKFLTVGYDLNS